MSDNPETRARLRTEAIRVLTQAARQTTNAGKTLDFADFLAHTLVAIAANVGGPERLLAGRPGSWEARHIEALIRGTVDGDQEAWIPRAEPLLIPLNVAELVEDHDLHPGLISLDEAIEIIDLPYMGVEESGGASEAWIIEVEALSARYENEYRQYAERFAVAARLLGRAHIPPIEVQVIADTSPALRWWDDTTVTNPTIGEVDPLVVAIWCIAHDTVALPNIDARVACADLPFTNARND